MIFEKQEYQQKCISNIMQILQGFDFKVQSNSNVCDALKENQSPIYIDGFSEIDLENFLNLQSTIQKKISMWCIKKQK